MNLFTPLTLRGVTFKNRIGVSPMCEYSSEDGFANDWHMVHLGSRAVGGAGLVMTEASAVEARGRITLNDLGIYKDEHIEKLSQITSFIRAQGAVPGMQLAHAGRKGSTPRPWDEGHAIDLSSGGWTPVAPSALTFDIGYPAPEELGTQEIASIVQAFGDAARRANDAGFQIVEIHGAHGYLLHEFLSPLSNQRTDQYGGSFENRTRIIHETVAAIRAQWPEKYPLHLRISATDWVEGGWDIEQSVLLAHALKDSGVDLIDCSTGGNVASAKIPVGAGYQVEFAARVKQETGIPTAAVGMITQPAQADTIVRTGQADLVLLAREMLRDPYWPLRAAKELHQPVGSPVQYVRAW